jgi:hypothetical protein
MLFTRGIGVKSASPGDADEPSSVTTSPMEAQWLTGDTIKMTAWLSPTRLLAQRKWLLFDSRIHLPSN